MKQKKNGHGKQYYVTTLCRDGKQYMCPTNRLVAEAFLGEIPPLMVVHHKDENKLNNTISNLEITTYSENIKDARNRKRRIAPRPYKCKITDLETGEILNFNTASEAASFIGVVCGTVVNHLRGELGGIIKGQYRVDKS